MCKALFIYCVLLCEHFIIKRYPRVLAWCCSSASELNATSVPSANPHCCRSERSPASASASIFCFFAASASCMLFLNSRRISACDLVAFDRRPLLERAEDVAIEHECWRSCGHWSAKRGRCGESRASARSPTREKRRPSPRVRAGDHERFINL